MFFNFTVTGAIGCLADRLLDVACAVYTGTVCFFLKFTQPHVGFVGPCAEPIIDNAGNKISPVVSVLDEDITRVAVV